MKKTSFHKLTVMLLIAFSTTYCPAQISTIVDGDTFFLVNQDQRTNIVILKIQYDDALQYVRALEMENDSCSFLVDRQSEQIARANALLSLADNRFKQALKLYQNEANQNKLIESEIKRTRRQSVFKTILWSTVSAFASAVAVLFLTI
jgi:hypothetical protein